jgi:TetR/AcrR family transcriptional regulator, repressor for uid operon
VADVVVSERSGERGRGGAASASDEIVLTGSDATANRLIVAASKVFAEKGYDGAGVAEIARTAGLTTGAIYSRFQGKADLLCAAIQATVPDEFDELFAEHAFDGRAKDILHTVGAHLVTRPSQPAQGMLLEAFVAARRDPEVAALLRSQFDDRRERLAALLELGKANGLIDPALDTYSIVHFAHAVGLGFLAYDAIGATQPDAAQWEAVIARVVAALDPADPTTAADLGPAPERPAPDDRTPSPDPDPTDPTATDQPQEH